MMCKFSPLKFYLECVTCPVGSDNRKTVPGRGINSASMLVIEWRFTCETSGCGGAENTKLNSDTVLPREAALILKNKHQ